MYPRLDAGSRKKPAIAPAPSASAKITFPAGAGLPLVNGYWYPREWTIFNPEGTGIELTLGAHYDDLDFIPPPPVGIHILPQWEIVAKAETRSETYKIDAMPGARLSLSYNEVVVRPAIWAVSFGEFQGFSINYHWAASPGTGARGFSPATCSVFGGTILAGATGAHQVIPAGARSVGVKMGVDPLTTVRLREYSAGDLLTGLSTEPVTQRDIQLTGLGGIVAVINGSGSAINVTYVFSLFL